MSRFTQKAKRHVTGSTILEDREKMKTDEIIARFPEGVTITDFDFLKGKNGAFVVCTFAESPKNYFNGGKILTDIFAEFVDDYADEENPLEATRAEFRNEGGMKVKLSHGRTKDGNNVTLIKVLE